MIRRYQRRSGESGFTLIELLIVIVILAILVAIVLFAVGGFTGTSAQAACNTDIKQVKTADSAYYTQNGSYPTSLAALSPTYLQSTPNTTQAAATAAGSHYFITWASASPPTVTGTFDDGNTPWGGAC